MRDVVIIGGGLTGLAAARELESIGVPYTLIEVKRRLGGSIHSHHQAGFIMDSGPMFHTLADPQQLTAYLESLGLEDALFPITENTFAFKRDTGTLVDALAAKITAPIMYRMAVSTLGTMDGGHFSICMENGLLLDSRALIVAAPALHAERMFHTLTPEISYLLLDYRYDTISRISVGYIDHTTLSTQTPEDYPITYIDSTVHPDRVPPGGVLLQAGLRIAPHDLPADPVGQLAALMHWPLNPAADHIATWTESDPIMWRDPEHPRTMQRIQALLPQGVALAGSDYIPTNQPPRLDERINQGIAAAHRVAEWLKQA